MLSGQWLQTISYLAKQRELWRTNDAPLFKNDFEIFPKERKLLLSQTNKWEDGNRKTGQRLQNNQLKLEVSLANGHPRARILLVVGFASYRKGQVKQDIIRDRVPMLSPDL